MRIAIVGCGQLARMLALAGWPMGYQFSFLAAPGEDDRCVRGLGEVVVLDPDLAPEALYEALGRPEVITVEREQVDVALLRRLQPWCRVYPDPDALAVCQHRGREKRFLAGLGIPTAPFRWVERAADLPRAVAELGLPVFVKSCEEGYDGQNQWYLDSEAALTKLLTEKPDLASVVVEGRVDFSREVSLIVARNPQGESVHYPLTENRHHRGILLSSIAPAASLPADIAAQARQIADTLLRQWPYVGVLAIECFIEGETLLVNELAPRVHNSGHWTQQAGVCSQFENHLRAITGLALGSTRSPLFAAMVNLLGHDAPPELAQMENGQLHLYNKTARPRRKMGHLNLVETDRDALERQLQAIIGNLYPALES